MKTFDDVVNFHGHSCPGLALGYRVSIRAIQEFEKSSEDEEIVAIVENDSCAVDAVQVITGCTFGKGNLIFRNYGKQVYTFIERSSGKGIRISVIWNKPQETPKEKKMWDKYMKGDRTECIIRFVHERKSRKIVHILKADEKELFKVEKAREVIPPNARIYPSVVCSGCGIKVMEPLARVRNGNIVCIPCSEEFK